MSQILTSFLGHNVSQTSSSLSHQSNQLSVQPTEDIGPLLRLRPVHRQSGHQDGCCLLVEGGGDALDLGLSICPAEDTHTHTVLVVCWARIRTVLTYFLAMVVTLMRLFPDECWY